MNPPGTRIIVHAPEMAEPPLRPAQPLRPAPLPVATPVPATWKELHQHSLQAEGDDTAWLADFAARVPGGCECQRHWREEITGNPPDFSDYFAWTVARHNSVNRRLDKPQMSVPVAREIWTAKN